MIEWAAYGFGFMCGLFIGLFLIPFFVKWVIKRKAKLFLNNIQTNERTRRVVK